MGVLVTGVAGFIGAAVAEALLDRGEEVFGIDILNAYYDPALKQARLARLTGRPGFRFEQMDVADRDAVMALVDTMPHLDRIVHLAAQAGVRYSLVDPYAYVHSNLLGQVVILEAARRMRTCRHLVYASSSSVYGANRKIPFSIEDQTDRPLSLYGATKKADELMGHAYAHLFRIPMTGLRFFTVYGPWGRPDMAAFLFTSAILEGRPIRLFNRGNMRRDFTYIDDIVAGVIAALDRPPGDPPAGDLPAGNSSAGDSAAGGGDMPPARVYNLGNNRPVNLRDFLAIIERETNRPAIIQEEPMQPGDVYETFADIDASVRDLGYAPSTPIEDGLPRFVHWYRQFYGR